MKVAQTRLNKKYQELVFARTVR